MKIIFKTLKIHNFLSFADESFDFLENKKMNLVCGKNNDVAESRNGSGKSAMFASLLYALFGQLQNKIRNENLLNRYVGSTDMSIDIVFSVDDVDYRIIRGLNKYKMSFLNLYRIEQDGSEVDLTKSSIGETDSFIENEVLHFDISIFLRTILLSSDQNYNFFRLKPQPKKDFIEKLFNISIFGDMYNLIHRDILSFDKTIAVKSNKLLSLNETEKAYLGRIEKFENDKKISLESILSKINSLENEYETLKKTEVKNNTEEVKKYEDALTKLNESKGTLNIAINKLNSQLIKLNSAKSKAESKKESKQHTVDEYAGLLSKLCEKCEPIVEQYYDLDKYKAEIEDLSKKIAEYTANITEIENKTKSYSDKSVLIDEKSEKVKTKITEFTSEFNELNAKLIRYEHQINTLSSDFQKTKTSENPYTELYEKNHKDIENETNELNELTEKYEYLKYAENIVSQDTLKKFIIKDLVQLLNTKIKYYLMRVGANYTCVFDENMDYEFITDGGTCEYDNFSSGERMRLMIAASFAFKEFMATRSNISSNILILDEFIDSNIDSRAIENILKILQEFTHIYNQSVYIISHRKEIDNSIFDNIIQVVKTDNISKITYLPPEK